MSKAKKILVIDVEATCWENNHTTRNEIIEIGITPIDIKTLTVEKSVSILVKPPTTEMSDFCIKLTTITPDMIAKDGIGFVDACHRLSTEFHAQSNIFASWGDYDRKAFEKNCQWNGVRYPFGNLHLNVKALYAATYGEAGNMKVCAEEIGIKFTGTHHRGVDDSRVIAKILETLLPPVEPE